MPRRQPRTRDVETAKAAVTPVVSAPAHPIAINNLKYAMLPVVHVPGDAPPEHAAVVVKLDDAALAGATVVAARVLVQRAAIAVVVVARHAHAAGRRRGLAPPHQAAHAECGAAILHVGEVAERRAVAEARVATSGGSEARIVVRAPDDAALAE